MVNFIILVMVGGGLGAMLREFVMLMVPNPVNGFPLDILAANLLAASCSAWSRHCTAGRSCPTTSTCCSVSGSWAGCRRFRALSMAAWC